MSMSLPLQIAIHQSAYTSAVGASKNNSSTPDPEQVQEICEACGQVIETASEYTGAEMLLGFIICAVLMAVGVVLLLKFIDWLIWRF